MWIKKVQSKYGIICMALEELTNPGFRYTFPVKSITNREATPGLYRVDFRGEPIVLKIDRWGEVRIANETPCRNESRLALELKKLPLAS